MVRQLAGVAYRLEGETIAGSDFIKVNISISADKYNSDQLMQLKRKTYLYLSILLSANVFI